LANLYIAAKAGRNPRHLKSLATPDRFPSLQALPVSDIDHRILEPLTGSVPPGGQNLILRHVKSFFNYAIKKGYAASNPVDGHEGNTATLWRHYYRGATKAEAEKFWAIFPARALDNIVPFAKAS